MASLEFYDKHNMVAYLEKSEGSEGFHQIINFLTVSHINYVLTKIPTIYASLIEQFFQTTALCQIKDEVIGITAKIDRKDKVVTEASIRRHLKLEYSNGISTLPTIEIFEQLARMGNMKRVSKGYSGVITPLFEIMLVQDQDSYPNQVADEATFISMDVDDGGAATIDIGLDGGQGSGIIHKTPTRLNDAPLSGVNTLGSAEGILSLHDLTVLCTSLTKKVESLEISQARRRAKVVIFDAEEDVENPSKQGRMIKHIDEDTDVTLVTPTKVSSQSDQSKDHLKVLSAAKVLADAARKRRGVANVTPYTRRKRTISTVEEPVNTAGASKPVSTADMVQEKIKDKGKAIMQESEQQKKIKKKEYQQISLDEEIAQKLYAEKLAKDTARQEQESDPAVLRCHAFQNRSFSVAEVRKNMCIYLKNQGGYKQSHFKGTSYEEIRPIFERVWDQNQSFVPKDFEIEKEVMKRPGFDLQQESTQKNEKIKSKQVKEEIDDLEKLTLKEYVEVIFDSEEVINVTPLAIKSPIVNWKSYCKGDVGYYEIHKANGSYKNYIFFSKMLSDFDKEDLSVLYILFNKKYASTRLGFDDLMLWGDIKIMFEPDSDDEVWKNHQSQALIEWKLYDSYEVHSLMLGEVSIHMLVEKKYLLP
ncbi:hypothetical protein Tco_0420380 [Tanacetum coccineum]